MRLFSSLLLVVVLCVSGNTVVAKTQTAGMVKTASGEVAIINEQGRVTAVPNMRFSAGDSIKTGSGSSVGLIFEDDTVVSLGANTEIAIEQFLFNPLEKELSLVARLVQGTFSLISGQIAKLAPEKVKLKTPNATLGVRGTKLLVKVD